MSKKSLDIFVNSLMKSINESIELMSNDDYEDTVSRIIAYLEYFDTVDFIEFDNTPVILESKDENDNSISVKSLTYDADIDDVIITTVDNNTLYISELTTINDLYSLLEKLVEVYDNVDNNIINESFTNINILKVTDDIINYLINTFGYPSNIIDSCIVKDSHYMEAAGEFGIDLDDYDMHEILYDELRKRSYDVVDDQLVADDGEPGEYWLQEDEDDFYDDEDDIVTESVEEFEEDEDDFYDDEDEDIETEFYDKEGNWDPIEDDNFEVSDEQYIIDTVESMQYIDFNKTSVVYLNDAKIYVIGIESNGDNETVTILDDDNDTYDLSDFSEDDIVILSDAVSAYVENVEE